MDELRGLATGIGSLPHKNAEQALDLIFKYVPQIPFWPQLPKRDAREGMVAQFSENFPCLRFKDKNLVFDSSQEEKELEEFYSRIISNDTDYFKISEDFASGFYDFCRRIKEDSDNIKFIKCQITGPFTFAASIADDKKVSLLHNKVHMQAIIKGLAMKAAWQIKTLEQFERKIILFIDEPYLGCFGSAYTPISRQEVLAGLEELTQGLVSKEVLLGVHCCGNTDWSIFTDTPAIDIISFDAYSFLERVLLYADNLEAFFKRGGRLCWGIVPTSEFSGKETPESLATKIKEGIIALGNKGLDEELIVENLLVSPSCGLGTLDSGKSEKIFKLLSEVSLSLKKW
ncbi:MAG: methionine synthase [Candidatus Omnitrophota bacterium]|nr:MAG: methionine synthase [Candidatus Omnitrophota bacterium]